MFPGGRVLSPPPTSHPFLVHVQNYGGRVPPILLDGCWQSTFTLFFLNLMMTVLQLFSNQVVQFVVIPWRLAFTPGKTRDRLGFALWILKFAFWKNHLTSAKTWCDEMRAVLRSFLRVLQASPETISQKSGVELLDPLLGWAILRPASDSTRALDPAESQIEPIHSTREPIPTPPRSSDEPAPWLSSRGCASPQPGFESCFRF